MRKLRAPTRKPIILKPIWPNAGVQSWYNQQLDQLINETGGNLLHELAAAWAKTPPIWLNSHITAADEALKIEADAAGVMFECGDKILLMRRTDGEWAFPGGKVEDGETAEAAARREAFEETLHAYNGLLSHASMQEWRGVRFATFVGEVLEEFVPQFVAEHTEYKWVTIDQALKMKLHPGVQSTLSDYQITLAEDAPSPTKALQIALSKWGVQTIRRFDLMSKTLASQFASRSLQATQISLLSQLKTAGFAIDFKPTPKSIEAYRAVVAENVSLIKSIPRKWHTQIEQKVWNAVRNGSDLNTLSKDLRNSYGVTVRRAALISRDQNAKAKAVIERVRQQEIGITHGIWMHSHAGKEPRPTHVAMNGERYALALGMWDSAEREFVHPGQLINCRCSMRAVIEGSEEYDNALEEPGTVMLQAALNNAIRFKGTGREEQMIEILQDLRAKQTKWDTAEARKLRDTIDKYLS